MGQHHADVALMPPGTQSGRHHFSGGALYDAPAWVFPVGVLVTGLCAVWFVYGIFRCRMLKGWLRVSLSAFSLVVGSIASVVAYLLVHWFGQLSGIWTNDQFLVLVAVALPVFLLINWGVSDLAGGMDRGARERVLQDMVTRNLR